MGEWEWSEMVERWCVVECVSCVNDGECLCVCVCVRGRAGVWERATSNEQRETKETGTGTRNEKRGTAGGVVFERK